MNHPGRWGSITINRTAILTLTALQVTTVLAAITVSPLFLSIPPFLTIILLCLIKPREVERRELRLWCERALVLANGEDPNYQWLLDAQERAVRLANWKTED